MSYADQSMSGNRVTSLVIVAILHIVVGYALVTGLAYEGVRQVLKRVTTVDIKEEVKKEEPPKEPPKPDTPPPPIVAPPPPVNIAVAPPPVQTVVTPPPAPPIVIPTAVAPPAPRFTPKQPVPRGRSQEWVTTNDYPTRALREEREGTTTFRLTVGPDGKVANCEITGSSGSPDLDDATCANLRRRARFSPSTGEDGQPTTGYYSNRVRWVIPKD